MFRTRTPQHTHEITPAKKLLAASAGLLVMLLTVLGTSSPALAVEARNSKVLTRWAGELGAGGRIAVAAPKRIKGGNYTVTITFHRHGHKVVRRAEVHVG